MYCELLHQLIMQISVLPFHLFLGSQKMCVDITRKLFQTIVEDPRLGVWGSQLREKLLPFCMLIVRCWADMGILFGEFRR